MKNISSMQNTDFTVRFEGNIIAAQVPRMAEELKDILLEAEKYEAVVADLSQVEYIDSTGITLIIGLYRTVQSKGKTFQVTGAREEIKNLLTIIQLDKVFDIN